jgi:glycosyltransferase involved in cell wall biosynthesis
LSNKPATVSEPGRTAVVAELPGIRYVESARGVGRLAFLLPNLGGGGVQKNTLTIAKALRERGFDIDLLLCSDRGPLHCQISEQINVISLPAQQGWRSRLTAMAAGRGYWRALLKPVLLARKPSKTLPFLPALVDYLREHRPATLLSATVHLNIEAVLAKAVAGVDTRIVATQSQQYSSWHGVSGEWRRRHVTRLAARAYRQADAVVAVSQGVADDLVTCLGLPAGKIDVIYNPIVTPELLEGIDKPVDHPWFGPGELPVILSVGRPGRQKDFITLIKAFARVREQVPVRLLILGEARDPNKKQRRKSELLDLAAQLGVEDSLDFQGFVHNPFGYMANAAVFVLSSRYEGFGNVIGEALACGCPVVSTDCPSGPTEILLHGEYGKLVPVGDDSAMARAILASLQEDTNRERLFRRASDFSLEPIARHYVSVCLGDRT